MKLEDEIIRHCAAVEGGCLKSDITGRIHDTFTRHSIDVDVKDIRRVLDDNMDKFQTSHHILKLKDQKG